MKELQIQAISKNLDTAKDFILSQLDVNTSKDILSDMELAIEEIFMNISLYAYTPEKTGYVTIRTTIGKKSITIQFTDSGFPYNPLKKEPPDINLSLNDRQPGGLGIFLIRTCMDTVKYNYQNNQNILTITKHL
jgi:anti-sigma regulatory factor (Ser/Thr protein kinase)